MVFFFLFTKIFFKKCKVSLLYKKSKTFVLDLLKAPSRHKKFFHQTCIEVFTLKVFFYFKFLVCIPLYQNTGLFNKLNMIFSKIGSNTLTRVKFLTETKFNTTNILILFK